jgi:hypothetical protein
MKLYKIISFGMGVVFSILFVDYLWTDFILMRKLRLGYLSYAASYLFVLIILFFKYPPNGAIGILIRGVFGGYFASVIGYFFGAILSREEGLEILMADPVMALSLTFSNFYLYIGEAFGCAFAFAFGVTYYLLNRTSLRRP